MKVLKIYDFVSERMKIKPVTNAEWEQVKTEIENTKIYIAAASSPAFRHYICCYDHYKIEEFKYAEYHSVLLVPSYAVDWFAEKASSYDEQQQRMAWWLGYFKDATTKNDAKRKLEQIGHRSLSDTIVKVAGTAEIC